MARCAARAASTTSTTPRRSWACCPRAAAWVSQCCCCCGASACALADVQLAVHAGGLVAVDRAVERVLARLQVERDGGLAALSDGLALAAGAALDGDVVLQGRGIGHRDRDLARLRGERFLVELQLLRVGRERELRAAAASTGRGAGRRRGGVRRAVVIRAATACEREQGGDAEDAEPLHARDVTPRQGSGTPAAPSVREACSLPGPRPPSARRRAPRR